MQKAICLSCIAATVTSLALARNFNRVLATEIAKPSVAAAQYNIAANHIDNVQIIRMAAEEFTRR